MLMKTIGEGLLSETSKKILTDKKLFPPIIFTKNLRNYVTKIEIKKIIHLYHIFVSKIPRIFLSLNFNIPQDIF